MCAQCTTMPFFLNVYIECMFNIMFNEKRKEHARNKRNEPRRQLLYNVMRFYAAFRFSFRRDKLWYNTK